MARQVEYFQATLNAVSSLSGSHRRVFGLASFAGLSLEIGDPGGAIRGYPHSSTGPKTSSYP